MLRLKLCKGKSRDSGVTACSYCCAQYTRENSYGTYTTWINSLRAGITDGQTRELQEEESSCSKVYKLKPWVYCSALQSACQCDLILLGTPQKGKWKQKYVTSCLEFYQVSFPSDRHFQFATTSLKIPKYEANHLSFGWCRGKQLYELTPLPRLLC